MTQYAVVVHEWERDKHGEPQLRVIDVHGPFRSKERAADAAEIASGGNFAAACPNGIVEIVEMTKAER